MRGKKKEISNSIFHKVVPLLNTQMYLNSWQICKNFLEKHRIKRIFRDFLLQIRQTSNRRTKRDKAFSEIWGKRRTKRGSN